MNNQCAAVSNLELQEYGCPHCGSKNMTRFFECGNMTIFICKECLCETAAICDGKQSCVEFLEENNSGFFPSPQKHPLANHPELRIV